MLKLFTSLFGAHDPAQQSLPAPLLRELVERAVDATDPRMRILSGYARTLREPVAQAATHLIALVDSFAAPLPVNKSTLAANPALAALCYSTERFAQIAQRDRSLLEFRAANPATDASVTALLVAERSEKRGFGVGEVQGQVVKDVPRTTIGFSGHLLLEPAMTEAETRRLLKRRAFDHVLALALAQISAGREEREKLGGRRALLRSKLDILQRGSGFTAQPDAGERARLQGQLAEIEAQLAQLGPAEEVLAANLASLAATLAAAEQHLWLETIALHLDSNYVLHEGPAASVPPVTFQELKNSQRRQLTVQLVELVLPAVPAR